MRLVMKRYPIWLMFNFGLADARTETTYVVTSSAIEASVEGRKLARERRADSRVPVRWSVLPRCG